ncbi:MAG: tetratricopeptide repeat protein, partial [Bryobacteraceae bacterium]
MKRLLAPLLLLCATIPARADTFLVLPFFNRTSSANLDWIGESVSETIRESLAGQGLVVLEREDRQEAYRRLSVRPNALLTRATVVKIGLALDAGVVVYGDYTLTPGPDTTPPSRGSLKITAHLLDLRRIREGPEFPEIGALEDLSFLETHLAWETLQFVVPRTAPSEEEFQKAHSPTRVDAVENYTRGLLAPTQEEKKIFFLRAARLDPAYSQPCYQIGKLFYQRKDYKSAADWLVKVAPADTHYHEANFLLGLCRFHL